MQTEMRSLGRAKNIVLAYFEQTLYIPKIYLNATWNGHQVDVLAIDRDGSGDVHAVLLYGSDLPSDPTRLEDYIDDVNEALNPVLEQLFALPAQYKYVAAVNVGDRDSAPLPGIPVDTRERSYAADGIGRVGYFSIDSSREEQPSMKILLKPERFRAMVSELAIDYIEHHTADWEIRP